MSSYQDIINEWRNAQDTANAANQERLDTILGLLEGQGETARTDARRASAERTAGGDQSLMDRGLFNTTILDAQRRREGEGLAREENRIGENVALQKAGVLERVTDSGPNFESLLSLLSQFGQGQGGQGGGGFSFGGINRPEGPIDPFGRGGNAIGGGGGGGGGGGSGVYSVTNPGAGYDPFSGQSVADLQQSAQDTANQYSESDPNLPVIPAATWFQNPGVRVQGEFVYNVNSGQLMGRKGPIGGGS